MTSIQISPPLPPSEDEELVQININNNFYGTGKFEYITDTNHREMLINAWRAITLTGNWSFIKQKIESFMFSTDPRINIIYEKMEELGYNKHSGCSFGCILREMQFISQNGEKEYIKHLILSASCNKIS